MSNKQRAVLYYLVAFYVLFMVYRIGRNQYLGNETFSLGVCIAICAVMGLMALGVIAYSTKLFLTKPKDNDQEE